MIYTVTLNPSLDYIMFVPSLQLGGVSRAVKENILPGGKGINVAVVLERLGFPCTALGFCAGHTGQALLSLLQGHISHTDFIGLPNGQNRINVKIKSTQESDINGRGPHIEPAYLQHLLQKLNALKSGDVLVLSGAVPADVAPSIYAQILQQVQPLGVLCVVDAVGPLLHHTLSYHPFLIKPNEEELANLFDAKIQTEEDVLQYAKKAQQLGAQNVLVSRGAQGALLVTADGNTHKAPAVKLTAPVVNSVGAGDSMVAGFLAGWLLSSDYATALQWALAAGGACVQQEWLPEQKDILTFIPPKYKEFL